METIVVVAHHRNQCYEKNNSNLGSPTFRDFKELSCRTFQSGGSGGAGILPTPIKACTTPDGKRGFGFSPSSPFSKSPFPASFDYFSEDVKDKNCKGNALKKSGSIPIPSKGESERERSLFCNDFSYSELWAGPAYSNSPPPSSLPIPKFFAPPKRTVSLDFPSSPVSDVVLQPLARSAPPSPKREHSVSARKLFHSADHVLATQDLRRILNLDVSDD
ncbi:Lysine-rich arabinogalactan protein like [Heracleum sosnowskyi]|uniref:Lysine-rich arabinogalactan protein like n=1 Tax=Heracleum sosnowskyi TaxID=360622 RepID=A0AAD8LYB7_9APIA|nr:Lysine-rich arabinogalactan protein like [Heracleum sosnowskyi]